MADLSADEITKLVSYIPQTATINYDPGLDIKSIQANQQKATDVANEPLSTIAQSIIEPQLPQLKKDMNEYIGQTKSSAQSDFLKRGITGSSTELQTLTRDIPAAGMEAYTKGVAQLTKEALPVAVADRQARADAYSKLAENATSLRNMVTNEQYSKLNYDQKERLTKADQDMQLQLKQIDQTFQIKILKAEQAFQLAENEKDRQIAAQQYQQLLDQQRDARQSAFMNGLALVGVSMVTNTVTDVASDVLKDFFK